MKVLLLGYGKMGKMVERLAPQSVVYTKEKALPPCDVAIDFSHPDVLMEHATYACSQKMPLVIGTTGCEALLPEVKALVAKHQGSALYAPNFSLGVALFMHLLKEAGELFAPFSEYERGGIETHHKEKIDAPSGTAKYIESLLDLSFTSVRLGHSKGEHTVIFDSQDDAITLTHKAHSREGFARGALKAASWLVGKTGWYTLDDMLRTFYSAHHSL